MGTTNVGILFTGEHKTEKLVIAGGMGSAQEARVGCGAGEALNRRLLRRIG